MKSSLYEIIIPKQLLVDDSSTKDINISQDTNICYISFLI